MLIMDAEGLRVETIPGYVTLELPGHAGDECALTPSEARKYAKMICDAADRVEYGDSK